MDRRQFIKGSAVVAVVAITTPALSVAESVVIQAPQTTSWWGYSNGSRDWFDGPFDTPEAALREALDSAIAGEKIEIALCHPRSLDVPDMRETCIEWLMDGSKHHSLEDGVSYAFDGANSDNDYDGEVSDELSCAEWKLLERQCIAALSAALLRLDRVDLAAIVSGVEDQPDGEPICDQDALLEALGADALLLKELSASAEAWVDSQNLRDVPRRIDLTELQTHIVPPTKPHHEGTYGNGCREGHG